MTGYPKQPLGKILRRVHEAVTIDPDRTYQQVTVRLFHKGVVPRGEKLGSTIRTARQWLVRQDQILLSRIDARNGAIGIVPQELDSAVVTSDFWAFAVNSNLAIPQFLDAYFGMAGFVEACNRASEGTTNRVRLQPDDFFRIEVPLPPLNEQRRIVARIENLSTKLEQVAGLRRQIEKEQQRLLLAAYAEVVEGARWLPMKEVAPLVRRPIEVEPLREYHELGIRSFGKGTFHKQAVNGVMLGTKKIFRIEPGDLVFNIVFAWEGAVAVARLEDNGRVGSHRFLTCVPKDGVAIPSFLCFHFLTDRGLEDLGVSSPGGAGRNRTLGIGALVGIRVPVPPIDRQHWFVSLKAKANELDRLRAEANGELASLKSSVLSKAFAGEL